MDFASLDLPAPVMQGIREAGFATATPIQEAALPLALRGKDVAGQSQTGTGKTAAFLIAGFTRLLRSPAPSTPAGGGAPRPPCPSPPPAPGGPRSSGRRPPPPLAPPPPPPPPGGAPHPHTRHAAAPAPRVPLGARPPAPRT